MSSNITQLISNINGEFSKLQSASQQIDEVRKVGDSVASMGQQVVSGFSEVQNGLQQYLSNYENLLIEVNRLNSEVKAIEFPEKFKQMELKVLGQMKGLDDVQNQLRERLEQNVEAISDTSIAINAQATRIGQLDKSLLKSSEQLKTAYQIRTESILKKNEELADELIEVRDGLEKVRKTGNLNKVLGIICVVLLLVCVGLLSKLVFFQ